MCEVISVVCESVRRCVFEVCGCEKMCVVCGVCVCVCVCV